MSTYEEFLKAKAVVAPERGYAGDLELNPSLKPHARDIAAWMIRGGNRACFASYGLHKTSIQLQVCESILDVNPESSALIVCPLGVRREFIKEAGKRGFSRTPVYVSTNEDHAKAVAEGHRLFLTNYERVRDGQLDPNRFEVCSLDEASTLRSYGSKTYQEFLPLFSRVPFKFVATATPSPNRLKELIHYAGFLGIMDTGMALTRFFKRDPSKAGNLTLHPHKVKEFWLWVKTWAVFIQLPSDLGYDDTGYVLPEIKMIQHRIPADHATAGADSWGQEKMFRNAAAGLSAAAAEKRDSLDGRIRRAMEIIEAAGPDRHWIIWHDLEKEREALERAIPELVSITGSRSILSLEDREKIVERFADGEIRIFGTKPSLSGSGSNLQEHCYSNIFLGIGYKANDFMQALHRTQRFGQAHDVEAHLIYTEAEDPIYEELMRKIRDHNALHGTMSSLIREYGLNNARIGTEMERAIVTARTEVKGDLFTCVNSDNVAEMRRMPDNSIDLIVTSWPFSDHYEYTEAYNDFGHNDGDTGFFAQMEYLTPEIIRCLKPGRMYCVHAKDRIVYGSVSGLGMYSVNRFSDKCADHLEQHGLICCGRITVVTDVVRENNQTYRLGWSENSKDGTKMGVGSPEYILLFRKLPTDRSNSYADEPVMKSKEDYTRARWQFDAHSFWRSSGNRFMRPEEMAEMRMDGLRSAWLKYSREKVYNFGEHVEVAQAMESRGLLPSSFMCLEVANTGAAYVWDDITRMRTLNSEQTRKGWENHVCLAVGSLVLTKERGYVPIQDVKTGESALTHKGRWRTVLAVQNTGVRPAITLRAQGVPGLTLTPDHKVWCRKSKRVREREGAEYVDPGWVESKDSLGGYVNFKLPAEEETADDPLDWWIVGRWLADGHWEARGGISISCGRHETDDLVKSLGIHAGTVRDTGTSHQISVIDSVDIRSIIEECGSGASGKHLPPEAFTLSVEQANSLLAGYLSGDGYFFPERGRYCASSVSKNLALGIAFLAQKVYGTIASVYPGRPERDSEIQGRAVKCKQDWIICFDVPGSERYKQPFVLDDGAWKKVRILEDAGEVDTWNLRVDEDESFTAEGCIVKNCPLQLDIVERLIERYSNRGDVVLDPFGGLGTVAYSAILKGRRGYSIELNEDYWKDSLSYCRSAEQKVQSPTLFDFLEVEAGVSA